MPRLYSIKRDFKSKNPNYNPSHFFPSASWGRHSMGSEWSWGFDLDTDFEAQCYIHCDHLSSKDNKFWIALRKDVERHYSGDCFYVYGSRDYRRWWNSKATSEYSKEYSPQTHGYWTFYFEEPSDQTMFILHHAELLSPKRYRFHPEMGVSCMDKRYDVAEDEKLDAWRI